VGRRRPGARGRWIEKIFAARAVRPAPGARAPGREGDAGRRARPPPSISAARFTRRRLGGRLARGFEPREGGELARSAFPLVREKSGAVRPKPPALGGPRTADQGFSVPSCSLTVFSALHRRLLPRARRPGDRNSRVAWVGVSMSYLYVGASPVAVGWSFPASSTTDIECRSRGCGTSVAARRGGRWRVSSTITRRLATAVRPTSCRPAQRCAPVGLACHGSHQRNGPQVVHAEGISVFTFANGGALPG